MTLAPYITAFGENGTSALIGLLIGLGFGALAQRSRYCFRAAAVELGRGVIGPKISVWLLAFAVAIIGTQALAITGALDIDNTRQLAARGSLSGAIIGGVMFGIGMILARGCASRILILSATGNLRALVTGLILTIVAQASFRGGLGPVRVWLAELWTVEGGVDRNISALVGMGKEGALLVGIGLLLAALFLAVRNRVSPWVGAGALGVGAMVVAGWFLTFTLFSQAFGIVNVQSISFIGPSTDTMMGFINQPTLPLVFGLGLVPGVFVGSFLASALAREFHFQCFSIETNPMPRYVIGAVLMGFGGMLAGGCAVGAAVTGGSVFSLTAWVALVAMVTGAVITDRLVDQRKGAEAEIVVPEKAGMPAE